MEASKNRLTMDLTVTTKDGVDSGHFLLTGHLDANVAPQFETTLFEKAKGFHAVTLDLTNLSYLSSAGLRVLLMAKKRWKEHLYIQGVSDTVAQVFELTGFDTLLNPNKETKQE